MTRKHIRAYGLEQPLVEVPHLAEFKTRAPTVTDKLFAIGDSWVHKVSASIRSIYNFGGIDGSGNAIWLLSGGSGGAPITEYVVAQDGSADYLTIQEALTAIGTSANGSVYIRPAPYIENLTFPAGSNISLIGAVGNSDQATGYVTLTGLHVPATTGSIVFRHLHCTSATHIFNSGSAGTAPMSMERCKFNLTNGAIYNMSAWTGEMTIRDCTDVSTLNSVILNAIGGATINIFDSNIGVGTTTLQATGPINIFNSQIGCATNPKTGSVMDWSHSTFNETVTFTGTATGSVDHCVHRIDGSAPIQQSSSGAISLSNLTIDSDTSPGITGAGAGILSVSAVEFLGLTGLTSGFASTLTLDRESITVGNLVSLGTITTQAIVPTNSQISFKSSPLTCTAANTGGVATGATGDLNLLSFKEGLIMSQFIIGAGQTIIKPVVDNSGLLCSLDLVATEGVEYNFGAERTNSDNAFTVGTSKAFFFEMTITLADISGGNPYFIGFRKSEANNATFGSYTDYYGLGMNTATSATNVTLTSELNAGGQTLQDSGDAWTGGDGGTTSLRVDVTAAGVVTATIDGSAPSTPLAFTFDSGDIVCPFVHIVHGAALPGAVHWVALSVGLL